MLIFGLLFFVACSSLPFSLEKTRSALNETAFGAAHFAEGVGEAIVETAKSTWHMARHPREAYHNLKYLAQHQNQSFHAILDRIEDECDKDSAKCAGEAAGMIALGVATEGVGEVASTVTAVSRTARAADVIHGVGMVDSAGTVARDEIVKQEQT